MVSGKGPHRHSWGDRGKPRAVGSQREGPTREGQSGGILKKRVSQTEAQPLKQKGKRRGRGLNHLCRTHLCLLEA